MAHLRICVHHRSTPKHLHGAHAKHTGHFRRRFFLFFRFLGRTNQVGHIWEGGLYTYNLVHSPKAKTALDSKAAELFARNLHFSFWLNKKLGSVFYGVLLVWFASLDFHSPQRGGQFQDGGRAPALPALARAASSHSLPGKGKGSCGTMAKSRAQDNSFPGPTEKDISPKQTANPFTASIRHMTTP